MFTGYYRLQQPHTVYLRIAPNSPLTRNEIYIKSAAAPDFQTVDEKGTLLVGLRISDPTVEPTRVFLNYCPTNILDDPEDCRAILARDRNEEGLDDRSLNRNVGRAELQQLVDDCKLKDTYHDIHRHIHTHNLTHINVETGRGARLDRVYTQLDEHITEHLHIDDTLEQNFKDHKAVFVTFIVDLPLKQNGRC